MDIDRPSAPCPRRRFSSPNSTLVWSWGRGDLGQLALGDDSGRDQPTLVDSFCDKDIVHIAASDFHAAFLTAEGELYTVGSNESGQLGIHDQETHLSPVHVAALDTQIVIHVACGQGHTVAVTDSGALASWGAAEFGQLGQKEPAGVINVAQPRILKHTRELHFVRVACGATHTLALTGSGCVYSFGQGTFGALGHGSTEICDVPTFVQELWGFGIVQISCGENHSVALSIDGQVFSWGRGKYGQLGHGSMQNETRPIQVKALADQMIVQVASGGDHTLALNTDGDLFAWGRGHWGQTGLGTLEDVHTPRQVHLPEDEFIVQASAGARHSVVLTESGKVFGWGDGEQGQLGKIETQVQSVPHLIIGGNKDGLKPSYVVAGGEQTFMVYQQCSKRGDGGPETKFETESGMAVESGRQGENSCQLSVEGEVQISALDAQSNSLHDHLMIEHDSLDGKQSNVGVVTQVGDWPIDNLHGDGLRPLKLPALMDLLEVGADSARKMGLISHAVEDIFSSVRFIIVAFKVQPSFWQKQVGNHRNVQKDHAELEGHGLDIDLIRTIYQRLLELRNVEVLERLSNAMIRLFNGIENNMDIAPESRWTRALLIGLQSPFVGEKGFGGYMVSARIFAIYARLAPASQKEMAFWLGTYPREIFGGRFVRGVLRYISNRKDFSLRGDMFAAMKVLWLLHEANEMEHLVPFQEFYSKEISEGTDLQTEYVKWLHNDYKKTLDSLISFCQVPFVLTPQAKSSVLQVEAEFQKQRMVQQSVFQHLLGDFNAIPFLILMVNRSRLIQDTLNQLNVPHVYYKKPLKVIFEGEDGVDEGGVTKEFFQLLCRELFNVDYGMFTYDEETRHFWFNPNSMESEHTFELVGIILGLAIYNNAILDVHLPLVVYKKMIGLKLHLDDLKDLQPQVARSLRQLLDFNGDVENIFSITFQVSYDYFGELKTFDLLPGGGDIPVTNENREKYVDLYVNYVLEESIKDQFLAFNRGFQQVCGGHALSLFRYEELELLICGLPHFDFEALEKVTIYHGGYTKDSQVIKWFWELVKEMTLEEKKSLLFFSTGNDRAPVGGLGSLQFIIQRNGGDTDRLPTAHTCFNVFMLPDYSSKSKLENRLKLAISNSIGFGLQ